MYDHNGLELTPAADTMNAYRLTAVDLTEKKFSAYASAKPTYKNEWSMIKIGMFKDSRDAAFVAQQFEKHYDKVTVRQMVTDKTFRDVANEFVANLEIPEWQYPAEGFTIEELLGGGYEVYKKNYVDNARDALVEAFKVSGKKIPVIAEAKKLIERVEQLYKTGITYREAAKTVI